MFLCFLLTASSPSPGDGTQQKFVLAFPENIAFYHPRDPQNKLRVTALFNDTVVQVADAGETLVDGAQPGVTLASGQTHDFEAAPGLELGRARNTSKTLTVTSTKRVTIQVIAQRVSSMQTMVVTASNQLSTRYLVPPVPPIEGTSLPEPNVTTDIAERGPFRLLLLNAGQANKVNVTGRKEEQLDLEPLQVVQLWISPEEPWRSVEASAPLAVLFGHACAIRHGCTCGQLMASLPPATDDQLKTFMVPVLPDMVQNQTFILVTRRDSSQVLAYSPDRPVLSTSGSALLYHQGLLLPLVPQLNFSACSVVSNVTDQHNFAVIVIQQSQKDQVHLGSSTLNTKWESLPGTEYVSATVPLEQDKNFIWHPSSTMAVYSLGKKNGVVFGSPAPVISTSPGESS